MNVAKSFKSCNLQDLQIGTSALYMLAEPSTPETAREEAIERSESGESISYSSAKEITDRHKNGHSGLDNPQDDEQEDGGYNLDEETGEIKESFKQKESPPRMESFISSDQDVCPMCWQPWPEHH
jgi:hypothetical protein